MRYPSRFSVPVLGALIALSLSGCSDSNYPTSAQSSVVSGVAQKGPMPNATVTVYQLDASGARSGANTAGSTNADGYYEIIVPWVGPSEVVVEGVYTDDLTGSASTDSVSLRAFIVLENNTTSVCNLNMLMHLATARAAQILTATPTMDFSTALNTAFTEVTTAFGMAADTDLDALNLTDGSSTHADQNAHLLLLSAATTKYATDTSSVSTADLLASLTSDFQDDGLLNGSGLTTLGSIGTTASSIDLDRDIQLAGTNLPTGSHLSSTPVWVNRAPVATAVTTQVTDEDTASSAISLTGTDADNDNLTVSISTAPSHGSLNISSGNAPLNVVYTPSADYHGSDSFQFRISDGKSQSAPVTVNLTITPVNDNPVGTAVATVNIDEDTNSSPINLTGTDIDGDALTVSITTNPGRGALTYTGNNAPLGVTYVPSADANGSDSFQFRVSDGNGGHSTPVTVNIVIAPVDDVPSFGTVTDKVALDGTPFSAFISATDPDGDTLTYSSTGTALPSWASFDTATGEISGTPNAISNTSGIVISVNDGTTTVASNAFSLAVADGLSCAHILAANPSSTDGVYLIDPDGGGGVAAFQVYCDMTTDGGGWAKIYQYPTRFMNSSTNAVGNIAVATNAAEAKLSDAQINAFQTLSGTAGSVFRMQGNRHPSGHKLYVRSSGTWQDDVTAFQLFNPRPTAGNNLAACLAADWTSCNLGNYTHSDYWLDTLRMAGGNLPTPDNATRYFIDHSPTPQCWANGAYPMRCFATGASLGNAPIGDFTMWIKPSM